MFVRKRRNEVKAVQETTAMVSSDVLARYRLPVTECTRAAWATGPRNVRTSLCMDSVALAKPLGSSLRNPDAAGSESCQPPPEAADFAQRRRQASAPAPTCPHARLPLPGSKAAVTDKRAVRRGSAYLLSLDEGRFKCLATDNHFGAVRLTHAGAFCHTHPALAPR